MSHKLLLADDSVTIQRVIELTFSGEDVEVLVVGDGEQAIARIPLEHPDIVLADIGMPKRSGYDVAAFVKGNAELKHIPVLLLAGAFEPVDEARAEQVGCNGVLVKPFEPQHVIARVRELLDGAKAPPARTTPGAPRTALSRVEGPAPTPVEGPVERPAPPRTLEFPRREEPRPPAPFVERESVNSRAAAPPVERDSVEEFGFGAAPAAGPLERAPVEARPNESLDEYFDRLDAAFATFDSAPTSSPQDASSDVTAMEESAEVPTLDDILGPGFSAPAAPAIDLPLHTPPIASLSPVTPVLPPVEPPDITATRAPQGSDPIHAATQDLESIHEGGLTPARSLMAEAFTALLAVEQGEPGARPVRLTSAGEAPAVTDALVDEVTRRVLARLAPEVVRDVVAEVVSEVAERLVREEIERIRSRG